MLAHNHFTTYRLVLECKRIKADDQRQLNWIFLIPSGMLSNNVVLNVRKLKETVTAPRRPQLGMTCESGKMLGYRRNHIRLNSVFCPAMNMQVLDP